MNVRRKVAIGALIGGTLIAMRWLLTDKQRKKMKQLAVEKIRQMKKSLMSKNNTPNESDSHYV